MAHAAASLAGAFEPFSKNRQKRTSSDDSALLSGWTTGRQQPTRSRSKTSRDINTSPELTDRDRVAFKAGAVQFLKTLQELDYLDQDSMII